MIDSEVNPSGVDRAELVVAIPSYNEAESIGFPTLRADQGLITYFPDKKSVIINCDNDSPDGTRDAFLATPTSTPKISLLTPPGVRGKGNNLRKLFRKVVEVQAKAVIVMDADLKTVKPEWVKHLAEPLFGGYSYVTPLYVRDKYDDPVTNEIAYPLTRALYGRRIRQPTGGEFGFSGDLAGFFLSSDIWDQRIASFGIDIWMTTLALHQNFRFCQTFMGGPRVHRPDDPAAPLGRLFKEIVGTIFSLMSHFEMDWTRVKYSKPTAIYGFGSGEMELPPKVEVDSERLIQRYHEGFSRYRDAWGKFLSRDVYMKLVEMAGMRKSLFSFPAELWARLLFDASVYYRDVPEERPLVLESLMPLYYGRIFSFVRKTIRMSIRQAEETIEEDCMAFEMTKPYLIRRWFESRPSSN